MRLLTSFLTVFPQIDALYECCNAFYQRNGDDASCVSCPKANLLRCVSFPGKRNDVFADSFED